MQIPTIKIKNNRLNSILSVTPSEIEDTFNSFDNIQIQSLIEQLISDDPDIIGLMQKRLSSPYYLIPSITPASDSAKDKEIAQFVYDTISQALTTSTLTEILQANFYRFSVHQIEWEISSGKYVPKKLTLLPRSAFEYKHKDGTIPNDLMIYDADKDSFSPIPPLAAIVTISKCSKLGLPISLIRIIRKYAIIKLYSLLDWSAFNEVFGMPLRLGKYSEESTPEDIDNLYEAVVNIGSDSAAVISDKDSIEFISPKNDNPQTFKEIITACKNGQSTAILGNSNVTGIDKNGSYAALKVLSQISEDIILSDITMINEVVNNQLITHMMQLNFGSLTPPKVKYMLPKTYKDILEIDEKLTKLGIKFNKDYYIKKYDLNEDDFEISPNNSENPVPNSKKKTLDSSIQDPFI